MRIDTNTTTATAAAYTGKCSRNGERHPVTLEGIESASQQLVRTVAGMVESGARRVDLKTVPCEEGFYYKVEGWK